MHPQSDSHRGRSLGTHTCHQTRRIVKPCKWRSVSPNLNCLLPTYLSRQRRRFYSACDVAVGLNAHETIHSPRVRAYLAEPFWLLLRMAGDAAHMVMCHRKGIVALHARWTQFTFTVMTPSFCPIVVWLMTQPHESSNTLQRVE